MSVNKPGFRRMTGRKLKKQKIRAGRGQSVWFMLLSVACSVGNCTIFACVVSCFLSKTTLHWVVVSVGEGTQVDVWPRSPVWGAGRCLTSKPHRNPEKDALEMLKPGHADGEQLGPCGHRFPLRGCVTSRKPRQQAVLLFIDTTIVLSAVRGQLARPRMRSPVILV